MERALEQVSFCRLRNSAVPVQIAEPFPILALDLGERSERFLYEVADVFLGDQDDRILRPGGPRGTDGGPSLDCLLFACYHGINFVRP